MTTQEKWLYQRVFLNGHLSKWQSLAISLMYEQEDGFITDVYASRIQQERKKNTTLSQHFQNPIEKSQKEIQLDTPNMQIHDRSLYWLGTAQLDTPNMQIHDRSLYWLGTAQLDTPNM